MSTAKRSLHVLDIPLDRDQFLRNLLRHLAGSIEDVVGLNEASGFISIVGQRVGDELDEAYRGALAANELSREQVGDVLVDLKRRIQGDFYIVEEGPDKIVLGNRACPFGDKVLDRPSLCMMTSNVFGVIASHNLGYAKVSIEKAIARGDAECLIVVHLRTTAEAAAAEGREYYKA